MLIWYYSRYQMFLSSLSSPNIEALLMPLFLHVHVCRFVDYSFKTYSGDSPRIQRQELNYKEKKLKCTVINPEDSKYCNNRLKLIVSFVRSGGQVGGGYSYLVTPLQCRFLNIILQHLNRADPLPLPCWVEKGVWHILCREFCSEHTLILVWAHTNLGLSTP